MTCDTIQVTKENLPDLLKTEDYICEAFDRAEAKAMLVSGVLEHFPEKYLVAASGLAGLGSANTDPDPPGLQTILSLWGRHVGFLRGAGLGGLPRAGLCRP